MQWSTLFVCLAVLTSSNFQALASVKMEEKNSPELKEIEPPKCKAPCDRILLHAGKDSETRIKTFMLPGMTFLKQTQFADHDPKNPACAHIFGHGHEGEVAGYSYDQLEPLFTKYKTVHIFACAQSWAAAAKIATRNIYLKLLDQSRKSPLAQAGVVRVTDELKLKIKPPPPEDKPARKKFDATINNLQKKLKPKALEAMERVRALKNHIGFMANSVVNLFPCHDSVCAWMTPTNQQFDAAIEQLDGQDTMLSRFKSHTVKDFGLQLDYPTVASKEQWPEARDKLAQQAITKQNAVRELSEAVRAVIAPHCDVVDLASLC